MKIVVVEKVALDQLHRELHDLVAKLKNVVDAYGSLCREEKWLDSQEVCLMLGISKRALQNYKDRKLLPYSLIHRKSYYKLTDVKKLLTLQNSDNQ